MFFSGQVLKWLFPQLNINRQCTHHAVNYVVGKWDVESSCDDSAAGCGPTAAEWKLDFMRARPGRAVSASSLYCDGDADNQDSYAGGHPNLTTTTTKNPCKNTSHSTRGIINRLLQLFSASACWQISFKALEECVERPCTVNLIEPSSPLLKLKPCLEGLSFLLAFPLLSISKHVHVNTHVEGDYVAVLRSFHEIKMFSLAVLRGSFFFFNSAHVHYNVLHAMYVSWLHASWL